MSDKNSFGGMLKWARMKTQWKQQQVADKLEVSRVTVSRWENDLQLPSAYYLKRLVTILELYEKDADALYRAAAQVPPIIDNLPFKQNPFFTGREDHLEQLRKQLQVTGTAEITPPISISGLAGVGKTELALEYAHRSYPNVYRVVLWVDADKATLQESYASLAQTLKLEEQIEQELGLDKRIHAVNDWLKTHTNWLLIMDNADDLPLAESFLPAQPPGHVVFTTQSQIIGTIPGQIEIEVMEPEDGLHLLLRRSHKLKGKSPLDTVAADVRGAALHVVELLGGHPLALDQAGAYIEEARMSFTDYLKRYHAERHRLLSRRGSLTSKYIEHPEPVSVTFNLSFEKACECHPIATDILHFCAFLQPDAIPEELFQHDDSFKFGTTEFDDAIAALHRYSLIKRNEQEKTLSMHRLVQAVATDAMTPYLQKQWRERVVRVVYAAFPVVEVKESRQFERLLPHILVCSTWMEGELTPTEGAGELFYRAANYIDGHDMAGNYIYRHGGGRMAVVEKLLARALSIRETLLGTEHLDVAAVLFNLGLVYHVHGKNEQAEPLLARALSIRETLLGTEHLDIVLCLYFMASLYRDQGRYAQAELLTLRALKISEKHLGAEHPNTAPTIYVLMLLQFLLWLHDAAGQHEQAEAVLQRYLSFKEQRFGAGPTIQQPRRSNTNFLHRRGHDAKAAALKLNDEPSI